VCCEFSAGIGRTGTFCAIDILLDHIVAMSNAGLPAKISVGSVVRSLRESRPGMVQVKEQYYFIALFIAHCIANKLFGIQ